jgi:glycosyltransferase involved in cell wall biosynthesis
MSSVTYSLIIPVFNEEETIPLLMDRLRPVLEGLDGPAEIMFVNDGSSDRSWSLLLDVARTDARVRLVNLSRNFGHQIAITAGMKYAEGEAIIIMDADLQDPPEVIFEMAKHWRNGFEVVYAQRVERQGESYFKRATASLFYRTINALSDIPIPVDTGDFRLISRRARDVFIAMPERDRFVRGMFAWIGLRQCAVPFVRPPRAAGETKYPTKRMIRLAVNGILSFSDVPLRVVIYFGFTVMIAAMLFGIWIFIAKMAGADFVPGWSSLFLAIVSLTGANITMLGVVGLYVGKIHNQVKGRPIFIVDSVVSGASLEATMPPSAGGLAASAAQSAERR